MLYLQRVFGFNTNITLIVMDFQLWVYLQITIIKNGKCKSL